MKMLDSLPLWALFILTVVVFVAAYEIGDLYGKRRHAEGDKEKDELGAMVGAMLGLLGFIMAITFGGQLSRFDDGKTLLLDEATAIYRSFLLTDMLPGDARDESRRLLYEYATIRSDTSRDVFDRIAQSKALQQRIWDIAMSSASRIATEFPKEVYYEALGDVIELHEKRVTVGINSRMPAIFWGVLYVLAALSFAVTGYHGGLASGRRSPIRPVAAIAFALLIMLIADLDRQGQGSLRLNQAALNDVVARMADALGDAGLKAPAP